MKPRFDVTAPLPALEELGHVHVLAIGGAGMSAVARLLLQAGCPVSGSDGADSPMLAALAAEGATVYVGHDAAHVTGADTVVVSSAIRDTNPELAAARAAGCRVLHRSQALAVLSRRGQGLAVAGANGKTTTTSLLVAALDGAGLDPSFAIGGELSRHGTNAHLGGGRPFVVEADESDYSFVVYHPATAVVTNVQPDHLDFYGTFEAVQSAYRDFVDTLGPKGLLVACGDDPGSQALAQYARQQGRTVVTYGSSPSCDVVVRPDESAAGPSSLASLVGHAWISGVLGDHRLSVPMPGVHNLLNATAAFVAATRGAGADPEAALTGIAGFGGVRRRFEIKGEAGGVRVVDDYAHNPAKVAAVVAAAVPLANPGRLVAVFQPHLYSRTRDFADAFAAALAPADLVVVADVYGAREDPIAGVSGALVADGVSALGTPTHFVPARGEVTDAVAALVRPGDLVLTIGAGDITAVGPELLERLG